MSWKEGTSGVHGWAVSKNPKNPTHSVTGNWLVALFYVDNTLTHTHSHTLSTYRGTAGTLWSWQTRLSCFALRIKKKRKI